MSFGGGGGGENIAHIPICTHFNPAWLEGWTHSGARSDSRGQLWGDQWPFSMYLQAVPYRNLAETGTTFVCPYLSEQPVPLHPAATSHCLRASDVLHIPDCWRTLACITSPLMLRQRVSSEVRDTMKAYSRP